MNIKLITSIYSFKNYLQGKKIPDPNKINQQVSLKIIHNFAIFNAIE